MSPISNISRDRGLVGVVEACYVLDGGESDWLRRILEALPAGFDGGLGVLAHTFEVRPNQPAILGEVVASDEASGAQYAEINSNLTITESRGVDLGTMHTLTLGSGRPFGTVSETIARFRDPAIRNAIERVVGEIGIRDFMGLLATDPSGHGIMVGAPLPNQMRTTAGERARYGNVSAHLAAGMRLRRALATGGSAEEAVLAPNGACHHAVGAAQPRSARDALRDAAKAIDRARGRLRSTNEDEALAIWRGLCAGRWSLVDRFDSDGRRFVIARRNEPHVTDPRELTPRERQVAAFAALGRTNKFIAYALGMSQSMIAYELKNAARKLGVRSRTELVDAIARLGPSSPDSRSDEP